MNKTGLIAKISIKYVLPICIWKYFWRISRYFAFFREFRGISRKYLNFAGPRPREISEALHFGHLLDLFLVVPSSNPPPLLLANWLLPASSGFLSCYVIFGLFVSIFSYLSEVLVN